MTDEGRPLSRRERREAEARRAAPSQPTAPIPEATGPLTNPDGTPLSRRQRREIERQTRPIETWTPEEEMIATGQLPAMTPELLAAQELVERAKAEEREAESFAQPDAWASSEQRQEAEPDAWAQPDTEPAAEPEAWDAGEPEAEKVHGAAPWSPFEAEQADEVRPEDSQPWDVQSADVQPEDVHTQAEEWGAPDEWGQPEATHEEPAAEPGQPEPSAPEPEQAEWAEPEATQPVWGEPDAEQPELVEASAEPEAEATAEPAPGAEPESGGISAIPEQFRHLFPPGSLQARRLEERQQAPAPAAPIPPAGVPDGADAAAEIRRLTEEAMAGITRAQEARRAAELTPAEAPVEEAADDAPEYVPSAFVPSENPIARVAPTLVPAEELDPAEVYAAAEEGAAEDAAVADLAVEGAAVEDLAAEDLAVEDAPVDDAPVEPVVAEDLAVEDAPVDDAPVEPVVAEDLAVEDVPVDHAADEETAEPAAEDSAPRGVEAQSDWPHQWGAAPERVARPSLFDAVAQAAETAEPEPEIPVEPVPDPVATDLDAADSEAAEREAPAASSPVPEADEDEGSIPVPLVDEAPEPAPTSTTPSGGQPITPARLRPAAAAAQTSVWDSHPLAQAQTREVAEYAPSEDIPIPDFTKIMHGYASTSSSAGAAPKGEVGDGPSATDLPIESSVEVPRRAAAEETDEGAHHFAWAHLAVIGAVAFLLGVLVWHLTGNAG